MQELSFIPKVGMTTSDFWQEVKSLAKEHEADEILMYMMLMLKRADAARVPVRRQDFEQHGAKLKLFNGVTDWFARVNEYGDAGGLDVSHYVISSGIREMVAGTAIAQHFKQIYASGFCFDQNGVASWPALALNYTTKTQYLFRINKGAEHVYDNSTINKFVPPEDRPIPFSHIVYIGDGETDVPCFRLVKELGGHSIAVYPPGTKKGAAKDKSIQLFADGRVNFVVPADYRDQKALDLLVKAIMDKVAAERHLRNTFTPR
jgi:hypothetical protein